MGVGGLAFPPRATIAAPPRMPGLDELFGPQPGAGVGPRPGPGVGPTAGAPAHRYGVDQKTGQQLIDGKPVGKGGSKQAQDAVALSRGAGAAGTGAAGGGGGGVRGGGGGVSGGGGGGATNTAQNDPYLIRGINRYEARSNDDITKRAIQDSTLGVMDAAALASADAKGGMAQRGISRSGAGAGFVNRNITNPALSLAAKNAAGITMAGVARKDALAAGALPFYATNASNNLANRQEGRALQGQDWSQQFQTQQAQQAANEAALNRMMQLYAPWLQQSAAGGAPPPTMPTGPTGLFR